MRTRCWLPLSACGWLIGPPPALLRGRWRYVCCQHWQPAIRRLPCTAAAACCRAAAAATAAAPFSDASAACAPRAPRLPQFLVATQAALTVVGNLTCWYAAWRIYVWAQEQEQRA